MVIAEVASWADDSANLGKGLPASSTSYVGSTPTVLGDAYSQGVASHNSLGEPLSTSTSVAHWNGATGSTTFSRSIAYNSNGSLLGTTELGMGGLQGERLSYVYDLLGNLRLLGGLTGYLNAQLFDSTNQTAELVFKNGSTELDRLYTYDATTNRLHNLAETTTAATLTHTASHTYSYNNAGMLTEDSNIATGQATDNQCYSYDHLGELRDAWTPSSAGCGTPSTATFGGPAPYWKTYAYDPQTGNRQSVITHSTTGTGNDTRVSYTYPTAAGTQPHILTQTQTQTAPTRTTTWTNSGSASTYTYNADGTTKTRPGQSLTWNQEGRLAGVTTSAGTSTNIYDADGNLLLQKDPTTGSTLYLWDTQLHIAAGSSTVTATRTYTIGGIPIAERSTTPASPTTSKLYWLNASPFGQNTSDDEVDAISGATTHRYLDPFGNPRGSAPAWSSTNGFLNQPTSTTTNTVHLGARDYDPTTGRFLSADSVLEPSNPLQNNGYTYGWNDPIAHPDPSGDRPEGDKNDTDTGGWGNITTCPSCSHPAHRFSAADGWTTPTTTIDTKTITVTYKTPVGRMCHVGWQCYKTHKTTLWNLMHPPPGPKNYCGSWSWACTAVGYNQARNCIATPSAGECFAAALALISDLTLAGGILKAGSLLADAALQLGTDSLDSTLTITNDELTAADEGAGDLAGAACGGESFTPDTNVVMADGSTKPLDQVKVGDKVEATNPKTGKTSAQTVTDVWVNHDNDLMDVTVKSGGKTSAIHATQHHLFWDTTRRAWVEADQLVAGDQLRTDDGSLATVASTVVVSGAADMWDLTVSNDHDFYIVTTTANVLVHNCPNYENPGHHDPTGGPNPYNPSKAVLPGDAESEFGNSVDVNGTRWSKVGSGRDAQYYRYFNDGNDNWHWSGSTSGVTSRGTPVPIPMDQVPISVRRG